MIKVERGKDNQISFAKGEVLPYLTLLRTPEEFRQFSGWHHYLDTPQLPCWALEVEYRCDSDYYYFGIDDLEELTRILKEVRDATGHT